VNLLFDIGSAPMINLRRLSIVALAAVLLVVPGAARAQGTPDQSQTLYDLPAIVTGPEASWAQTFRAGLSGSLEVVDLVVDFEEVTSDSPLVVELQSTSGGEPSGQVLATASIPVTMVPGGADWAQFRLDPCRAGHSRHVVRADGTSPWRRGRQRLPMVVRAG
jgi:hypothetical protein